MGSIRRTAYAFFCLADEPMLDLAALLRGELPTQAGGGRVLAFSILTGERHLLAPRELDLLMAVPAGCWVGAGAHDPELIAALVDKGLLLTDADAGEAARLREREEALAANEWNPFAALYHYMTKWGGLDIRQGEEDDAALRDRSLAAALELVAQHGRPPGAFAAPRSAQTIPLPPCDQDGELYRILTARRTTRAFDVEVPMTVDQLGTVLKYVFGCHGYARMVGDVLCIKRTSPSGGGLHPIETYPIVTNVAGLQPGIYHYDVAGHALSLLSALEADEIRTLATSFMCGQTYFGAAHVSFVMTARFYRNHWKYRRHPKAYAGILMDAAHLSQTLYLVSAEVGLGAFVTLAINSRDIEHRLGLDGITEGVIAISGCGPRIAGSGRLEPTYAAVPDASAS